MTSYLNKISKHEQKIVIKNSQFKLLVKACQFIFYILRYLKYMLNKFFLKG